METPKKPTILFLEDDADTRTLVKFTLEDAGINVLIAESVNEAWKIALGTWTATIEHEIDLFLLDGLIPHGDSLKLCADLRKIEPTKPIVFYSGLAYKTDILKGLEAGATAYLTKPYTGDLAEEITRYIFRTHTPQSIGSSFEGIEDMFQQFDLEDEATSGDSVRISEFPSSVDRSAYVAGFGKNRTEATHRQKQNRAPRASGGII